MRKNLAIFLSGTGSNFEAIAQACENHELDAQISVVFSNNPSALGVIKAQHRNIPTVVIPHYKPRQQFDLDVIAALENYRIDWVILCGYMRILSPAFLAHFQDKVINIHPSLLPHYPGVDAVARAFAAGEKRVGVTVHFVDAGVDTGPIILQEELEVSDKETLQSLLDRVHRLEHEVYKKAIASLIKTNTNESI